jgi:hypothetical protein
MIDRIINFLTTTQDPIFWVSATLGTTFFALRLMLSFFGGGFFEHDMDVDDLHDMHHHDGALFKFLTIHSLSGFLMMFGWAGLACSVQFKMTPGYSMLIALGCGIAMLIITASLMHIALSLEGAGAVFSSKKAVGLPATVIQRIPAHGQGKVQVIVNGSTRELLAQSHSKKPIESFNLVKVVKAIDHEVVEVVKIGEESK